MKTFSLSGCGPSHQSSVKPQIDDTKINLQSVCLWTAAFLGILQGRFRITLSLSCTQSCRATPIMTLMDRSLEWRRMEV